MEQSSFYILTNAGCPDFKLVIAPTAQPARDQWRNFVVPPEGDKIEDVDLFSRQIVLYLKRQGEAAVEVHDLAPSVGESRPSVHQVPIPKGSVIVPGINMVRFHFTPNFEPRIADLVMERAGL